jgi:hypothetical protein
LDQILHKRNEHNHGTRGGGVTTDLLPSTQLTHPKSKS